MKFYFKLRNKFFGKTYTPVTRILKSHQGFFRFRSGRCILTFIELFAQNFKPLDFLKFLFWMKNFGIIKFDGCIVYKFKGLTVTVASSNAIFQFLWNIFSQIQIIINFSTFKYLHNITHFQRQWIPKSVQFLRSQKRMKI